MPWPWAAAVLLSLAGGSGTYFVHAYRLGQVEDAVREMRADRREWAKADADLRERLVRVEENTQAMRESLMRIERKLDRGRQ